MTLLDVVTDCLLQLDVFQHLRGKLEYKSSADMLLDTLVGCYREYGGKETPTIAIADWEGQNTRYEHLRLADLYTCKRQFIQRRATARVKPEQAALVDGPALERELTLRFGEPFSELHIAASAKRRHRRPFREWRFQACDPAPFLVDGHPERQIRHQPRRLEGQFGDLLGVRDVACEQDHAAEAELASQRPEFRWNLMTVETGD